jgi:hypothetical protein
LALRLTEKFRDFVLGRPHGQEGLDFLFSHCRSL